LFLVHAHDKDSGLNGRIVYAIDDPNFTINEIGEISAARKLDADQNRDRFFIYRFNVTAEDRGQPRLKAYTTVHIRTENTNDEPPIFMPTREYHAWVAEDAQGGTPVVQIQAIDPDRDQISYAFLDQYGSEVTRLEMFEIDPDTGLIKLLPQVKPMDLMHFDSPYNLTVIAKDDGSCCTDTEHSIHSETAIVRVGISDVSFVLFLYRPYAQQILILLAVANTNCDSCAY
jgi:hypothetical protein